ncbi:hypothetical protein [Streptosporangium minutum]|uniref:hypothetical protein n=1 Tax=Streptosporangium minutum TaxID=569862 RepID=UPI001055D073|nr:hypothetical protein [Streptosporangium minutum]
MIHVTSNSTSLDQSAHAIVELPKEMASKKKGLTMQDHGLAPDFATDFELFARELSGDEMDAGRSFGSSLSTGFTFSTGTCSSASTVSTAGSSATG